MTFDSWLQHATDRLSKAGISTARLDALVLAEDIAGKDRAWLLAHPDHSFSKAQETKLKNVLNEREHHIPLAYLRGKTEFYGRTFAITNAVLEPRPESETMIDLLKALSDLPDTPRIADVGTGSGALGITAALELPGARMELLDVDSDALALAKNNVDLFTLSIPAIHSDLLANTHTQYDVLLCNLPYVPDDYSINTSAAHEPAIAIFGGTDGLAVYRQLFNQLKTQANKPLYILTEALPPQHEALSAIAADCGYRLLKTTDFIQIFTTSDFSAQ